jgi:hypothetical protein
VPWQKLWCFWMWYCCGSIPINTSFFWWTSIEHHWTTILITKGAGWDKETRCLSASCLFHPFEDKLLVVKLRATQKMSERHSTQVDLAGKASTRSLAGRDMGPLWSNVNRSCKTCTVHVMQEKDTIIAWIASSRNFFIPSKRFRGPCWRTCHYRQKKELQHVGSQLEWLLVAACTSMVSFLWWVLKI